MVNSKKHGDNLSGKKIDPVRLALLGAFITLIGDFISFMAALIEVKSE